MTIEEKDLPTPYLGSTIIGSWFGVQGETVSQWRIRYPSFPAPDVVVTTAQGRSIPGWSPRREAEIRAWRRTNFSRT